MDGLYGRDSCKTFLQHRQGRLNSGGRRALCGAPGGLGAAPTGQHPLGAAGGKKHVADVWREDEGTTRMSVSDFLGSLEMG